MAWDSSRPVPWQRLVREWLIYVGVMALLFVLVFRNNLVGALAGLLISGPLYLGFGFVLAKFGYQRTSLKDLRTERENAPPVDRNRKKNKKNKKNKNDESDTDTDQRPSRSRPAPTSRTSTGRGRPGTKPKRRTR